MISSLNLNMLALIAFCVLAETVREICFKHAANDGALLEILAKPVTWVGIFFWAIELLGWAFVLQRVALSVAFPLMALSYVTIVIAGTVVFKEKINIRHAAGVLLITAGVVSVGVTGV
jgi:drug/metabolite transporter (DMT)-like permease